MTDSSRRVEGLSVAQRALLARQLRTKTAADRRQGISRRAVGLDTPMYMTPMYITPLHPIRGAERDPLFFVHAVGGTVHAYAQLAAHLADTWALYGIEAAGLREGSTPRESVEDMALAYLQAIRQVQPHGPYRLGGWSMGGLVAFEIARSLETAGDEIALLTLLDTAFPSPLCPPLSENVLAAIYAADAAAGLGLPFDPPLDFSSWPVADQLCWTAERLGASAPEREDQPGGELARRFEVFKANMVASIRYRPQTVHAPTLVIDAANSPNRPAAWADAVKGDFTVVRVPADHYTLLTTPAVRDVAVALRAALSQAPMDLSVGVSAENLGAL